MISFGMAILPTSCRSAPNSRLRRWSGPRPISSPTAERKGDDALGMDAGVSVIGLDHVAEHERGTPIGGVELEQRLEALMTLVRSTAKIASSGSGASTASGLTWISSAMTRPTPTESGVDRVHPQFRELLGQPSAAADRESDRRGRKVGGKLGEQGDSEQRRLRHGAAACPTARTRRPGRGQTRSCRP